MACNGAASGRRVTICDSTLRDGNHAVAHSLTANDIALYAAAADAAGIDVLEVGHGNGLGASSLQVGIAATSDRHMLEAARGCLRRTKLGVLSLPGVATIKRDLLPALDCGVEMVRVGAHCTEADLTQQQIALLADRTGVEVSGVLMMSHMASPAGLLRSAQRMEDYGARCVIVMDSAGAYREADVYEKVGLLASELAIPVGFHAHNNLGLAVANALAAIDAGAEVIDVTARGFGAGAGNAPLELIAANLQSRAIDGRLDLYKVLDAADVACGAFIKRVPTNDSITIMSGLSGVFSGYATPVQRVAAEFEVDPRDILRELGKHKVIAGQEDMIVQVAQTLAAAKPVAS